MSHFYPSIEAQLYNAIESGNLKLVSQYMSSGIGINTILFNPKTHKSMTVLSSAAHENQVKIVQYLAEYMQAPINYQDSLLHRSALHWACLGNSLECAKLLINGNSDINACDRDNVTPIIFAAMIGSPGLTRILICNGAQVTAQDRLHSSALHYATFHGRKEIIQLLIRAGGISNEVTVFGQGTPLANLTYHTDFESICLLIEAGYNLSKDSWIPTYEKHGGLGVTSPDIASYLKFEYSNPPSLHHLSKISFRNQFKGVLLEQKVDQLLLPKVIKDFILLRRN